VAEHATAYTADVRNLEQLTYKSFQRRRRRIAILLIMTLMLCIGSIIWRHQPRQAVHAPPLAPMMPQPAGQLLDNPHADPNSQILLEIRLIKWDGLVPSDIDDDLVETLREIASSGQRQTALLMRQQSASLIRMIQSRQSSSTIAAPRLTLFNGQRGDVIVSTSRVYVSGFKLLRKIDGSVNTLPQLATVESGVHIDAQPISADGQSTLISLRGNLTNLLAMREFRFPNVFDNQLLSVQSPVVSNFPLDQEIEIPLDRTLLVSGMTQIDPPKAGGEFPPERVIMLINVARAARP
jgi:hypothetical protein